jgi:NAD+ synthase
MPLSESLLKIDEGRAAEGIEKYIRDLLDQHSARGILIGLSGGLDSAVLSTLAVRALGKGLVHVCYLYDRDSEKDSQHRARLVADRLGLELHLHNIDQAMQEKRIYAPLIVRLSGISGFLSRCLVNRSYRLIFAESPFVSTLRQSEFDGHRLKKLVYKSTLRHIEAGFNARHIYRREVLEKQAEDRGWLLLGAANRSECLIGWFVKGGIDDLPLSPLMGLYKTQVRQLAAYLGIPSEIRSRIPSPDMMKGLTDEFVLGINYSTIDVVLDGMDRGLSDEEMIACGIARKQISRVRELNRLSAWKRESKHAHPPVDGGTGGGIRVA